MVCSRCKMVVKSIFEKFGLHPVQVELGEVELTEKSIEEVKEKLKAELKVYGFYLLDDKKSIIIEKVKTTIIELVHQKNDNISITLSDYLAQSINQDYSAISNLFSEVEGITIEKFYILQKVERVKELIVYDELSLTEIADKLNYSSVAYLSNQFKKVTGLSPSHFKRLKNVKRNSLEEL